MDVDRLMKALAYDFPEDRYLRVVKVPNPAAGADLTVTVPGNEIWHPLSVNLTFTASAAVGNRTVALFVDDQTDVLGQQEISNTIPAAAVSKISWFGSGNPALGGAGASLFTESMPDVVLPAGFRIGTSTGGIDVADQISSVKLWVEVLASRPIGVWEVMREGLLERLVGNSLSAEGVL